MDNHAKQEAHLLQLSRALITGAMTQAERDEYDALFEQSQRDLENALLELSRKALWRKKR